MLRALPWPLPSAWQAGGFGKVRVGMTGEGALSVKGRLSVDHSPMTRVCVCVQVKVRLGYAGGSLLSASPESFT